MSTLFKIGITIATVLLVGVIGAASVLGWGLDRPATENVEDRSRAHHPERGYIIYYGSYGRRGGIRGGGGFRGGK